ncbi:MAG TPA: poly-gamma-glutamate hydrolase family protein, partial [Steroidobacteraceae bacterium]|nr:poly-gamma-glutamate hydrolase family protein [Steroidobacteraceae bacterium]
MTDSIARGKYGSFAELARHETAGKDYRIEVRERTDSSVLVVAPHGGMIEAGTSQIAASIAGEEYHLFSFEGLKPYGENRALHITSHRFDHPRCLDLASRSTHVLSVHGCLGESCIHVGGLDED